jgi:hypothetical protein
MSSANPTCVLLFSLAENACITLPDWYNDVCSQARNLCAPYEPTGALTLVATAITWNAYPGHITNLVDVLANGDEPQYLARPTWALPAAHPANAAAAVVSLYREELARNHAFVAATSAMAQALLVSIGPDNKISGGALQPGSVVLAFASPNRGCHAA